MLKRRIKKAGLIISGLILIAVVSNGIPVGKRNDFVPAHVHKQSKHHFDSTGLCTCIPFTAMTELSAAPRIQLNKNAASFVKQYNTKNGFYLDKEKNKAQHYFTIIDSVLEENEVPAELIYLAYIESGMKLNASSRSGATGPWAFMPLPGKQYGLKISKHKDERLDYYKSTNAAAALLKDLYTEYQDWLLVIAAYNCGPGLMQKAIKLSGSRDYWSLQNFLPKETRSHVKRFIAVHYHFEGHGSLVTMSRSETEAHEKAVEIFKAKQNELEKIGASIVPWLTIKSHKPSGKAIA